MLSEAFEEAKKFIENQGVEQQEALNEAKALLAFSGVKDPSELPADMTFGKYLRQQREKKVTSGAARRRRKMYPTQERVAVEIGISSATYRNIELGLHSNPTVDVALAIQDYFNIPNPIFMKLLKTLSGSVGENPPPRR
jgi:DNA-binding XRE family transcriptional regulator